VAPLLDSPRDATLYHNAYISGNHRWRLTNLRVGVSVGFGDRDLQREATSPRRASADTRTPQAPAPTPGGTDVPPGGQTPAPGGTPTPTAPETPTTTTTPAVLDIAQLGTFDVTASVSHELERNVRFGVDAGYHLTGGLNDASRAVYPVLPSVDATATLDYQFDGRNTFITSFRQTFAWGTEGSTTYLAQLDESWQHRFSRRTTGNVDAGIAYSRTDRPNQPTPHTIYPVGGAGINYTTRLARGTAFVGADVSAAPQLDLVTGVVDPRLSIGANAGWRRDRFSTYARYSSSLSLTDGAEGALSYIATDVGVAYEIGLGFSVDGGVRETWQRFEGITLIEPTTVFYVGLDWSGGVRLNEPRTPR
jgi:hypothetical protein